MDGTTSRKPTGPRGSGIGRRGFAGGAAAAAFAPLVESAETRRLTVDRIEVFTVPVNHRGDWLLVRLTTRDGLTGIGDASHGQDARTLAALRGFSLAVKGRELFRLEVLRQAAIRSQPFDRSVACAFSALEQCAWDLRGKALGLPVSELMGGRLRDSLRCYANINRAAMDRSPAGFAGVAEKAVAAGFDAIKLAPWDDMPREGSPEEVERVTALGMDRARAVREVIGPQRDLLLDAHSHFALDKGLELARRVEPLKLFWLEEVTPPDPPENLARINREAAMPTAGGESLFGVKGFLPYVTANCVNIAMPDIKYCGGAFELKKIAALCEGAGMRVAPHGPASPIGHVAAAQVCATLPNFLILEYAFGETTWRADLIEPAEELVNGRFTVPARPGWGFALNEQTLASRKRSVIEL